tara:strand:+ start:132933 stop:133430 length:498 start_codon:yes stop_codon:yes gene_type:complete
MIGNVLLHLIAHSLPVGLLFVIWKCNSRRWARLAKAYRAAEETHCFAKRTMQTVMLVGGDVGRNSYKGIVTVSVGREGILLELMLPFSTFHPPLLIPYSACDIEPRQRFLMGDTFQYTLRDVSDVKIIVHDDLQDWIESQAASLASVSARTRIESDAFDGMATTV